MPRLLPPEDFRARRTVLTRSDFAIAPGPERTPSDMIDKATWDHIVILPDDVAVRTSSHHGTALRQMNELQDAWIVAVGDKQDYLSPVMLDSSDEFQASTYLALTGYYRLSVAALRSAIELVAIGAWAQVCNKGKEFREWRAKTLELKFGTVCDGLQKATTALGTRLQTTVEDNLFKPKSPGDEGGFARRIFSGVSDFAHSRPGSADGDLRKSNGPIYVKSVFEHVAWLHFEVFAFSAVFVLLARPKLTFRPAVVELLNDEQRVKSGVTRAAFDVLHRAETHRID
jgi:hypothetical protein